MKDQLFNDEKVRYLAGLFDHAVPGFDGDRFHASVMERLIELELKERINWIAECLSVALPGPLDQTASALRAALPPPLDPTLSDDDFGDFIFAPIGEYIVQNGLSEHPDLSLDLLADVTQRFSMEWAVRPFLNSWQEVTLARMTDWAEDSSYHVRRLVSEGSRPRLPWGQGVTLGIGDALPLLDRLYCDPTRYVTRSVANHLNDITKKDPDLVIDRLVAWQADGGQTQAELDWMTRHALRGLVKAGHPRALTLLGFDPQAKIDLLSLDVPTQAHIGGALQFSATLCAPQNTGAIVDYVLWRQKADGTQTPKVFKLKQIQLAAGAPVTLSKTHKLKGDATTFRLFPGAHRLDIQVNGVCLGQAHFQLI